MRAAGFKEGNFLVYTCPVAQHTLDKGTLLIVGGKCSIRIFVGV